MKTAYLDYNATAPVWPEARAAIAAALGAPGNASAAHQFARVARKTVEVAREAVARLAGANPREVVFTSGGTEANNLAIQGPVEAGAVDRIIISAVEHPSVVEAARATGKPVDLIPVGRAGVVDLGALEALLRPGGARTLVAVMAANNETGVIQPVGEVAALAHRAGALVHVDAVQAAGRIPLRFESDLLSLSAHKIGGAMGAGALLIREGVPLAPQARGGGHERRRRAGTENVPGIAGFGAAATMAPVILDAMPRITALRDALEAGVLRLAPDAEFFGAAASRLGNTSCFTVPGLDAALQVMALDLAGVAVSAGAACASGKVDRSPVLTAMGAGVRAGEAIRVSLGWHTTEEEVDLFLNAYDALLARRRARRAQGA